MGLSNYRPCSRRARGGSDVGNTLIITVCSVTLELVLGMLIAQAMYRAIFARTAIRASVLVPYGAVTVVAAFAWRLAFDPATGFVNNLFNFDTPLFTTRWGSFLVIILAEVWKTTPFIALLLLGGLALVPDDLYKAAKVDGASSWQRFWKITLPLIRPALMVALLFRTLDAFRIYDTVFIMTRGANDTGTVSILGYEQLVNRLNLGLGSAVSILIFFCVILIAVAFTKFLGASPPAEVDDHGTTHTSRKGAVDHRDVVVLFYALVPVIWIMSLSLKDPDHDRRREVPPDQVHAGQLRLRVQHGLLHLRAAQLDRDRADRHGPLADLRLDGGLRDHAPGFPGQGVHPGRRAGHRDVPADLGGGRPVRRLAAVGLYDTWLGLILPYMSFALPLSIYTLSAFFREIPWDLEKAAQIDGASPLQAFRKVILPLAMPGVFTAGILTFIAAWNDFLFANVLTSTDASRTAPVALAFFRGASQFTDPSGAIAAGAVVVTIPILIMVLIFQRRIVSGLTAGAVKG